VDGVPVYNVAVHVTGRDFWSFELDSAAVTSPPVAIDER